VALSCDQEMGTNQSTFDEDFDESACIYDLKYELGMIKLPAHNHALVQSLHDTKSFRWNHKVVKLEDLPIELCLHILSMMQMNTLLTMARASKKWNKLANTDIIFQKAAASRFKLDPLKMHYLGLDPFEKHKWREIYKELDSGIGTWTGFAVDYITNHGNPYEMELIIKSSGTKLVRGPPNSDTCNFFRLSQMEGCCRWKTLDDSLTSTFGAIVDPEGNSCLRFEVDQFLNSLLSRHLTFTETGVVRGLDLVVPNIYQGLVSSNVILGSYDPGHPDLVGSFICVLQDSVPLYSNFKSQREYAGIWMSSDDKAIYMCFTIDNVSSGSVVGNVVLYPFVPCRTTTRSAKVDSENSVNLQLKFQVDSSNDKYLCIHGGQLSLISSSSDHQIWVQECVPIMNELHINLFGDTITCLFSHPRPGCFFLNPIN
jgi:hypothetical protein